MPQVVWVLEGGDGFECAWLLGIFRNKTSLTYFINDHFRDFVERPSQSDDHLYRPSFLNFENPTTPAETDKEYEHRMQMESEEEDIRQMVNYVRWTEVDVQ
jgi:hypothetical protein